MPTGHHQRGCVWFRPRVRLREVVPTFVVVFIVVAMLIDHPLSSTSIPFRHSFLFPLPFSPC